MLEAVLAAGLKWGGVKSEGGKAPPPWGQTTPQEFLDLVWVGPHFWPEIIYVETSLESRN